MQARSLRVGMVFKQQSAQFPTLRRVIIDLSEDCELIRYSIKCTGCPQCGMHKEEKTISYQRFMYDAELVSED